jgi:hypothetical protein
MSYDIIMSSRFNVAAHQYVKSLKTRKSESYEPDRKRSSDRSDPRLVVGNVRGQLRHRVDAEVATVRHDRGQHGADVFGRSLLALSRREERLSFAVEFDQPCIKPQLRSAEANQFLEELEWLLLRETVKKPDKGDLVGKTKPVMGAPALAELS